jgi:hypothetical protein
MPPSNAATVSLLADGFRRAGPAAGAGDIGMLRDRLVRAASGQGRAVQDGLAVLGSWENASTIMGLLPAGGLGRSAGARRALQRVLRALGTQPTPAAALAAAARGTLARVGGRVLRSRWKVVSHIWSKGETSGHNVRRLVEEGHDFFLGGLGGLDPAQQEEILIVAAGGWFSGPVGTAIDVGDTVEVIGFVDRLVEHASRAGSSKPRGEPMALALRAGDDVPLVVRKIGEASGNEREHTLR